ncbi:hypothetical protein PENTCL1PPCAC_12485, partial [Pristionchus entomophagus]
SHSATSLPIVEKWKTKTASDNMASMANNLIEETIEKEETSLKKSIPESEKKVERGPPSAMHHCKLCLLVFETNRRLTIHISYTHTQTKVYKARKVKTHRFPCDICSYRSLSCAELAVHMCSHSGERPHKCSTGDCSEGFTSSSFLKQHHREVHNLKPYHCSICGE